MTYAEHASILTSKYTCIFIAQIVAKWILTVAKDIPSSEVAKMQSLGLVAIALLECLFTRGAASQMSQEIGELAELLSYRSMPVGKIQECQECVCNLFSSMEVK